MTWSPKKCQVKPILIFAAVRIIQMIALNAQIMLPTEMYDTDVLVSFS